MPNCLTCGAGVDEYDSGYYSRNMQCIPCYVRKTSESMVSCSRCGTRVRTEEAHHEEGMVYCAYCASEIERVEREPACPMCKKKIESWQKAFRLANGQLAHSECVKENPGPSVSAFCSLCGTQTAHFRVLPGGRAICAKCDREGAPAAHDRTIMASIFDRIGAMIG